MIIAANVGVLDEVELIIPCINHLRSIGVDVIVVGDMGSTDGTRQLLAEAELAGDVFVIDLGSDEDMLLFHQRLYNYTLQNFPVDRVLAQDADEFWIPKTGMLKNTVRLGATDELRVNRFNMPLVDGFLASNFPIQPHQYAETFVVCRPTFTSRAQLDTTPNMRHILTKIGPKAIVSPLAGEGFTMGGHAMRPRVGANPVIEIPGDLIIAHAQYSSWPRFSRKISNVRRSLEIFESRIPQGAAWQWKRWRDIADQGLIEQEYQRQSLTRAEFSVLLADGSISSVADYFEAN